MLEQVDRHFYSLSGSLEWVYAVLYQLEWLVTPRDCINLTGLVFNTNYHFDNTIQNWLLEQVNRHFYSLSGCPFNGRIL